MRLPLRKQIALCLFLTCVIEGGLACGGNTLLKSFRVALAASAPLVNSLVASGAIPQSRATAIIADFDAGAQCGLTLQQDFAGIPKGAVNERAQKFAASQKAFKCFRAIIDRQNFAAHPRLQQVASIADGVLASLVIFYSDDASMADDVTVSLAKAHSVATIRAQTEKDLERQMEAQMKALQLAMQP